MAKLAVGQRLWYVPNRRGTAHEVEIVKIGRKWAELNEGCPRYRIDMETLSVDGRGFSSPGRCHLDREAYEMDQMTRLAWHNVQNQMSRRGPGSATLENIQAASTLLGLECLSTPRSE
jgi:hypothetical protein